MRARSSAASPRWAAAAACTILNARHRSQAGPLPRVQAAATGDDPGFGMRGNGSLGPLYDPDSGGVLGAAGALPAGAGGRALFFAVAATKYM